MVGTNVSAKGKIHSGGTNNSATQSHVFRFTKQGITFTALLPIRNDFLLKSTPCVLVLLVLKLPSMYCLTILVFPTLGSPISTILNQQSYVVSIATGDTTISRFMRPVQERAKSVLATQ